MTTLEPQDKQHFRDNCAKFVGGLLTHEKELDEILRKDICEYYFDLFSFIVLSGLRRWSGEIEDAELVTGIKDVCENSEIIDKFTQWLKAYMAQYPKIK
jgi:hypothetical protein